MLASVHKREANVRLPLLGRLEDQIIEGLAAASTSIAREQWAGSKGGAWQSDAALFTSWCSGRSTRPGSGRSWPASHGNCEVSGWWAVGGRLVDGVGKWRARGARCSRAASPERLRTRGLGSATGWHIGHAGRAGTQRTGIAKEEGEVGEHLPFERPGQAPLRG